MVPLTGAEERARITRVVPFLTAFIAKRTRHYCRPRLLPCTLLILAVAAANAAFASPKDKSSDRPKLPYNMMGLGHDDLDAYDSKAEPVAAATAALLAVNRTGWNVIHKYFPRLGSGSTAAEQKVHPEDALDARFFAAYLDEDAMLSPIPLLSAVWSLNPADLSGRLKALHDEVERDIVLEDYSTWTPQQLRDAVSGMTDTAKTAQGTRYRAPKPNLSFRDALRLYAMTITLIRRETKWADKTDSPPPDMRDFTSRLSHQLPRQLPDGTMVSFFLYRPGVMNHPFSKNEFEEHADVVRMKRTGNTVEVEQFPVYLTAKQKDWNPAWIEARDEVNDTTLVARKFEHDWTRLDGPYLWFRGDQLDGKIVYRATAKFLPNEILIEAEREIESRGAVKRVDRPADYDPRSMAPFDPAVDTPAIELDELSVDFPSMDEQVRSLKAFRYFSNSFRAWCAYGLSSSGLASDGKTWISVAPDQPRTTAPSPAGQSQIPQGQSASQVAAQQ